MSSFDFAIKVLVTGDLNDGLSCCTCLSTCLIVQGTSHSSIII